jgi:hypothetical protein
MFCHTAWLCPVPRLSLCRVHRLQLATVVAGSRTAQQRDELASFIATQFAAQRI